MRASVHAAVCLCLLAEPGGAAPQQRIPRQQPALAGAVQGIVRALDGRALGGVRLVFRRLGSGGETVTINTGVGVFLLRDLTPGAYSINATLDGFEPLTVERREVTAGGSTIIELTLKPLPGEAKGPENLPIHNFDGAPSPSAYHVLLPPPPPDTSLTVAPPLPPRTRCSRRSLIAGI